MTRYGHKLKAGSTRAGLPLALLFLSACAKPVPVESIPEAIARNNRGVALMEQMVEASYAEAEKVFAELAKEYPDWPDGQVNLAIAMLNVDHNGKRALPILAKVIEKDPAHLAAHYCTGVLLDFDGKSADALPHFELVAKHDPSDAYTAYFIAKCYDSVDPERALEWYRKTIELNPYFKSAYYRHQTLCRQYGKKEEGQRSLEIFQKMQNIPAGIVSIVDLKYGQMGPKADAKALPSKSAPAAPVQGPVFEAGQPLLAAEAAKQWAASAMENASITAADINGDGLIDLFIAGAGDARNAVLINDGKGQMQADKEHPLGAVSEVNAALWGDYDNDGLTDVYFCRRGPNQLWRQTEKGKWQDVTAATETSGGERNTVDGALFDADHDGDLDIFLVNADGPNELLNNDQTGKFRPIAGQIGIAGSGKGSKAVLTADLDADRDTDIVVVNHSSPTDVFVNDRTWKYDTSDLLSGFDTTDVTALAAADGDVDGYPEIYVATSGELVEWARDDSGKWKQRSIGTLDSPANNERRAIAAIDVTGDGAPEILLVRGSSLHILNRTTGQALGAAITGFVTITNAMLEPERGPSLVALPATGGPVVYRPGSGRQQFASFNLTGKLKGSNRERSNSSGIGAKLYARVGGHWSAADSFQRGLGKGQSLQPVALGLGAARKPDFVRIIWNDGVLQTEMAVTTEKLNAVVEVDRMPTSCPILFVWNGERFEFVSDLLAVGGLGYFVEPGKYAEPDPTESFLLPEGLLAARDGSFQLKLAEPMEELTYLDHARLVAYDLPPGWNMTVDERMGTGEPLPTGEPVFYRQSIAPVAVTNERGADVTDAVRRADQSAADPGPVDGQFLGRLAGEHVLTLLFDKPLDSFAGQPVLVADGWVEFPYSQTIFAAWQAGAKFVAPTIEARDKAGQWHRLLTEVGYPAGMPRQMSVPLPALPKGCSELRIRTNLEVYWDRLLVAQAEPCAAVRPAPLGLSKAKLHRVGFAQRAEGKQRLWAFNYDCQASFADVRYPAGNYTAYGPVEPLVQDPDSAVAIFGPGEEVHLEFADSLPPLEEGWRRRFVLEVVGWCKDMDLYTGAGETVAPIPTLPSQPADRRSRNEQYNWRYRAGTE